jgi:hypothetical protein
MYRDLQIGHAFQRHEIKARRLNPAGFFVDGHFS